MTFLAEIRSLPDGTQEKRCTKCGEWKPATREHFTPNKDGALGLRPDCKECRNRAAKTPEYRQFHREYDRKRYNDHRDEHHKARRKYYVTREQTESGRERTALREAGLRRCADCKTIYPNTTEYFPARHKDSDLVISYCRTCSSKRVSAYCKAHPEVVQKRNRRRYAIKRGAVGDYTQADVDAQLKCQKHRCYYCHEKLSKTYHVDHVIPLSRGGSNGPENIVLACPHCNCAKNDRMPHEWAEGGRLL